MQLVCIQDINIDQTCATYKSLSLCVLLYGDIDHTACIVILNVYTLHIIMSIYFISGTHWTVPLSLISAVITFTKCI